MPLLPSSAFAAILGVLALAQVPPAPGGPEGPQGNPQKPGGRKGVPVAKAGGGPGARGASDGPRLSPVASQYIETETLDPGTDRKIVTFEKDKETHTVIGTVTEKPDTKALVVKTANGEVEIPAADVKSNAPVDGRLLLDVALAKMGASKLDGINGMSFSRFSRFWNNQNIWCIEAPRVRTFLNSRIAGRVDTKSRNAVHPVNGKPDEFAVVENGNDRFFLYNRTRVLSSADVERRASAEFRTELVLFLAPWIASKFGTEVEHVGLATLETFEPKHYELPPKNWVKPKRRAQDGEAADPNAEAANADVDEDAPRYGWTEYVPVTRHYEVVRAEMPDEWAIACGPSIWLLLDPSDGHMIGYRFEGSDFVRPEHVGRGVVTYWILDSQEAEGVTFPKTIDASREGSAHRSERIEFGTKITFASELADQDLARP